MPYKVGFSVLMRIKSLFISCVTARKLFCVGKSRFSSAHHRALYPHY